MAWFLIPLLTPIVLLLGAVAAERLEAVVLGGVPRAPPSPGRCLRGHDWALVWVVVVGGLALWVRRGT